MLASDYSKMAKTAEVEDLSCWDPMVEDYENKAFNSYHKGPGKNMPEDPIVRKSFTNLFVRGIPANLNVKGVRNLFGEYGQVLSCVIRFTPNYSTNIAFVTMATVDQCNECIRYLNGRQFGADRIGVEFAKSQDDKERDRKERAAQDRLITSFGSGRTVTTLNDDAKALGSHRNLKIQVDNSSQQAGANGHDLNTSYKASHSDRMSSNADYKECEQCGKPDSKYKCVGCHVLYCSQDCQNRAWTSHKQVCGQTREGSLSSSSSQAATASSDSELSLTKLELPLHIPLMVTLVEFQSPAKFFVQLTDNRDTHLVTTLLNKAIQCSLYGLTPYKRTSWTDFSVQICTQLGLTVGQQYSITCVESFKGNQVFLKLPDGRDLGDCLIDATGASVNPKSKYCVWDSLHRYVHPGDSLFLKVRRAPLKVLRISMLR
ncbi:hypothetical protein EB796_023610 [Bugula neritina]|uniref:Uncharacterized protein n=1 Tax=Bugula neritina TaxID=10212 RepID=A0A7J7IW00_BUGNE|nr:hypothetical protein EB796_023610 [Bugula neritina]